MQEVDGTGKKHSGTNDTNDTNGANDDLILTIIMRAAIRPSAASVGMSGSPGSRILDCFGTNKVLTSGDPFLPPE